MSRNRPNTHLQHVPAAVAHLLDAVHRAGLQGRERAIRKGDSIPHFNGGGDDDESATFGGRIPTLHILTNFS